MTNILRIDASSRHEGSQSRLLGDRFEAAWTASHPGASVVRRDLATDPIPHIADATIAGFYAPANAMTDTLKQATQLSDALIAELRAADVLLITTPMYNFSIPSALKAWIDQIVRIGQTFSYDGLTFTGLVTGKRAYVAVAYGAGGYVDDGPLASYNTVQPYLTLLLSFLGFTEIAFVGVEATTADEATAGASVRRAIADAEQLARAAA